MIIDTPFHQILAQQVDNSHQLLNKYTSLLGQTEHTARLLLDPQWQGAEAVSHPSYVCDSGYLFLAGLLYRTKP